MFSPNSAAVEAGTAQQGKSTKPLICGMLNCSEGAPSLQFSLFIQESTVSFMPFPFIHQLGRASTRSAMSPPTFLSMEVTSALPAAGRSRGKEGGVTWSNVGIYNKVALTVVLKTFTQCTLARELPQFRHVSK